MGFQAQKMTAPPRNSRAFTMLELLSAILIIAVLATMVTFFTASYIQWSQQVADQRTLVVLNDALTRYKCEGGDMNALTSGAPAGHIIAKLANTINWNGYVHQVMQKGVTYSSKSLTGAGYHQTFKFTGYNSYSTPVNPGQDIVDRLASQGTPPDSATANWIQANATSPYYLVLSQPSSSTTIGMTVTIVGTLYVNWGDDTTATYSGSNVTITHTYASAGNYGVILSGQLTSLSSTYADGHTAFGGDISTMPCLTYLSVAGTNTLTGSVTGMTGMTHLYCNGPNTLSGSVSGMRGLVYLNVVGSNTLTGSISGMTGMTYIYVTGSNTVSGSVTGMSGLTMLGCWGSNSITGSITGMSGLTYLGGGGSSTLSGSVTGITVLTYLNVGGSNTITGSIVGMTALQVAILSGNSSCDYSAVDWSTMPSLCNVWVKGMTQPQVDTLLAGMWANKDAAKPTGYGVYRTITCTNGCAAPSAAGYTNKANLQGYKTPNGTGPSVWTVTTN